MELIPFWIFVIIVAFATKQIKNQSQKDSDEHKVEMSKLNDEIRWLKREIDSKYGKKNTRDHK